MELRSFHIAQLDPAHTRSALNATGPDRTNQNWMFSCGQSCKRQRFTRRRWPKDRGQRDGGWLGDSSAVPSIQVQRATGGSDRQRCGWKLHRDAEPASVPRGDGESSVVCLGDALDYCQAEADTCVVGVYAFGAALKRLDKR